MGKAPREGPISVGDALDVEAELRPRDAATRAAIEELLGLDRVMTAPVARSLGPWKPNEPGAVPAQAPTAPRAEAPGDAPPAPPIPEMVSAAAQPRRIGRVTFQAPGWAGSTGAVFSPMAAGVASLPPLPLFQPIQAPAILGAALATLHDGSEVDVDRATAVVAEGRRLERIPYRRIPTLRRGAQLLIDRSQAMDPLRDDIEDVLADLRRILGPGHLEVLSFLHCPSAIDVARRGVWVDGGRRRPWKPAGKGVPVLVVSDLAMAPPFDDKDYATVPEWVSFFTDVKSAQCHAVALVPYSPGRWPPALTRAATLLHWSERTTARQVIRALREGRARQQGRR